MVLPARLAVEVSCQVGSPACSCVQANGAKLQTALAVLLCKGDCWTYDDGNGCLPDDQPVVGQARAKGALQGAGGVDSKLVGTRGGLSNGHVHVLHNHHSSQQAAILRPDTLLLLRDSACKVSSST
jgi:hypothetical protein